MIKKLKKSFFVPSFFFYFGLFRTSFDELVIFLLLFRLWMLMYAYKESPFPWRDSLLQPQFVSQLCIVVAVLSNPEFVGGCRSTHWYIFLLFRHWLFKYVCKEWSVSMVKLVIAATVCESAVHSSCSAFTPGVLMAKEKSALVSMTILLLAADGHYLKCMNQIHFSFSQTE